MKKIKYINQFINLEGDTDSIKFLLYVSGRIKYDSVDPEVEYAEDEYLTFMEKYSNTFRLELVYG